MSTAAHAIDTLEDLDNTNVVKVVLDAQGRALYFSRAPIPWWRDARASGAYPLSSAALPLRHMGLYAYHAGFLRSFPSLPISPIETIEALEQLRVLWHGHRIAVPYQLVAARPWGRYAAGSGACSRADPGVSSRRGTHVILVAIRAPRGSVVTSPETKRTEAIR
jgi:hypothetical protein